LSCSTPESNSSSSDASNIPGYRSESNIHKVRVSGASAADASKRGQLVEDYGSFQLVEVSDAELAAVAALPGVELQDEYNVIRLNAGAIDTASEHGASLRGMVLPESGKALHLIQFVGPVQPAWYKELQDTGVRVITYIPNNAYLVYGDAEALTALGKMGTARFVQWNGAYLNDFKLDPSLSEVKTGEYQIQLVDDPKANAETIALVEKLQLRDSRRDYSLGYVNLVVPMDRAGVYELAGRPDVVSIHPYVAPMKRDERQNMIVSGNLTGNTPTGPGYLAWLASKGFTAAQFTASNFGVDVSDSGIDNATQAPNHFALYALGNVAGQSRVVYNRLEGTPNAGSTLQGCDGHGNINAHIVGGFVNLTGAPHADAQGYLHGLGVAPWVKVGSSVVFDPNSWTNADYEDLQSRAYRDGMRVSTNSWGNGLTTYTADAQRYDALVRDAQPTGSAVPAAGNQEMVIVFAAGNSGPGATTVGNPGVAKNIITAGASEHARPFGGADACAVGDTDADSAMDIVGFSSRGPTGDGRKKPDLMAPGTHVGGGVAQAPGQRSEPPGNVNGQANTCFTAGGVCGGPSGSDYFPTTQQWYTASSGTSHSCPAIAGGAALVRQYFINQSMAPASPAMTKAVLMNSARYMTGTSANDTLFSNNQGMGLMDLGRAFDNARRQFRDQQAEDLFTATGQTRVFSGFVSESASPIRVTLAWTDAPGATTGGAWKNNLDLTVTVGGATYRGNSFTGALSNTGSTSDDRNNVESVFLPAGASGPLTVTVTATNINSDGVPDNATALDQDFALVLYNFCGTAPAALSDVTAAPTADNEITLNWTTNGASEYRIFRSIRPGGPYTSVGTVTAPPYVDVGVSGSTTYHYVVRSFECAESANSNEASATATGQCTLPPEFAGLTSATNGAQLGCTNELVWPAARPVCGGAITYSVHRSETPGFPPDASNRIATGLTTLNYDDVGTLVNGTRYYYVVRATEVSNATNEDTNTVERSAVPTGVILSDIDYFDDFDGNRPPDAAAYWIPGATSIQLTSGCHYQSPTTSYRFGAAGSTSCGGTYANSVDHRLVLGGNGTVAGINGFTFPNRATVVTMTFNHWFNFENAFDGASLDYSTTGPTGPWTQIPDAVTAGQPYITAGGYTGTVSGGARRVWTNIFTSPDGALRSVTVNLEALGGQTVWFAFRFFTDSSVVREGHYLDDVRINASRIAACQTVPPPPSSASAYRIKYLPTTSRAGVPSTFDIVAVDPDGQRDVNYTGTATFTSSDPQADLPDPITFVNGAAVGVQVEFRTLGSQTITATDTADPALTATGSTTVAAGLPASLQFTAEPTNAASGTPFNPVVKVTVYDAYGNVVSASTDAITMTFGNNPSGATLQGNRTVAAVAGVASFTDLAVDKVGTGYTLVASSGTLTGDTSNAFNITPGAPAKLGFRVQPSTTQAGANIAPAVEVSILDRFDNQTDSTATVTVDLGNNPGSSTLSGTLSGAAVNGIATFSSLWLNKVGIGYTLVARSTGLTSGTSAGFDITPATPVRLEFTVQPSNSMAGAPIAPPIQVTQYDRFDNLATQSSAPVTLTLNNNPTGASLRGTTTVAAVSGVATFSNVAVDRAGNAFSLNAGASGMLQVVSLGFDVAGASGTQLVFTRQPSNARAGSSLGNVQVSIQDASGGLVVDATPTVTLALGNNPSSGTLSGTLLATAIGGVATFSDLSLDKVGAGYTLVASSAGLTDGTSSAFDVSAGAAARLAFSTQPTNTRSHQPITPAVGVTVEDAYGNVVTSPALNVTLGLGSNPSSGTLKGTLTAPTLSGVATFANLSIDKKGDGYTLTANAGGIPTALSNSFNVGSGNGRNYMLTGLPASITAGVEIQFNVQVLDAGGNDIPDYAGTATVTSTDTAATLPANATFASGKVDGVRITFRTPGLQKITVTDSADDTVKAEGLVNVTNFPQPTVRITSPAAGTSVTGQVSISAEGSVASGTTLTGITILVDGKAVGTSTTSPASATWDVSKAGAGEHTITAVITDGAGNVASAVPVSVSGGGGCGCSTTGGADLASILALLAVGRQLGGWMRRRRAAR